MFDLIKKLFGTKKQSEIAPDLSINNPQITPEIAPIEEPATTIDNTIQNNEDSKPKPVEVKEEIKEELKEKLAAPLQPTQTKKIVKPVVNTSNSLSSGWMGNATPLASNTANSKKKKRTTVKSQPSTKP